MVIYSDSPIKNGDLPYETVSLPEDSIDVFPPKSIAVVHSRHESRPEPSTRLLHVVGSPFF